MPENASTGPPRAFLTPSEVSHWIAILDALAKDGKTVDDALVYLTEHGVSPMQAQMLIRAYMVM